MSITDLGVIQQSASLNSVNYAQNAGGDMHSVWWYWFNDRTKATNLVILNHDTGDVVGVVEGPAGRPYTFMKHPDNNHIYLGTFVSTSSPGKVASLNHVTGEVIAVCDVPAYAGTPVNDGVQSMTYSDEPHKRIYVGTSLKGGLFAYDPVTDSVEDFGIIDDPVLADYNRYISAIQINDTYAYCCMKTASTGTMYLIIVTLSNGSETTVWKADELTTCLAYRGLNGYIYIKTIGTAGTKWYLTDGNNAPILQESEPSVYDHYSIRDATISYIGYAVSSAHAYPLGDGDKAITIEYKKPGDTVYRTLTVDLLYIDSYGTNDGGEDLNGNLFLFGEQYSPTVIVNHTDRKVLGLPAGGMSGYAICRDSYNQRLYLGGYPNGAAYIYNPNEDWLSGTNPIQISLNNPESLSDAYHIYFCEKGSDKKIWFALNWARSGLEGQVVNYDIASGYSASADYSTLREFNMANACMNMARNKLIFSGYKDDDGALFVIPVRKAGISKRIVALNDSYNQGRIVSVETDYTNVNRFVGITIGASFKSYCINIGTNALIWGPITNIGTSSMGSLNRAGLSPIFAYGFVWFYVGTDIVKLDPANGNITVVQAVDHAGMLFYAGGIMYHMDSSTKHIYKLE